MRIFILGLVSLYLFCSLSHSQNDSPVYIHPVFAAN